MTTEEALTNIEKSMAALILLIWGMGGEPWLDEDAGYVFFISETEDLFTNL